MTIVSACGVQTRTTDGRTSALLYFGFGPGDAPPFCSGETLDVVETTRLGLWFDGAEAGAGFSSARRACVPERCHAVFFVEDRAAAEALAARLEEFDGLCLVERRGGE
jgi:hypothetical protein